MKATVFDAGWQLGDWAQLRRNPDVRGYIVALYQDWAWLFDPAHPGKPRCGFSTCAMEGLIRLDVPRASAPYPETHRRPPKGCNVVGACEGWVWVVWESHTVPLTLPAESLETRASMRPG